MTPFSPTAGVTFAALRRRLENILENISEQGDMIEALEQSNELMGDLFRPRFGGREPGLWFQASRMWALGAWRGDECEPEDVPAFGVLSVTDPSRWKAAQAHVASARAAVAAMRRRVPELRDCVSEAVSKFDSGWDGRSESLDQAVSRWTVAWPAAERKPDLTRKTRRGRESDAELAVEIVEQAFSDLWEAATGGQDSAPPEPWAMALDHTLSFLGKPRPVLAEPRLIQTLLVPTTGSGRVAGSVMTLQLELVGGGRGVLYPAPALGFVKLAADFRSAIDRAATWIKNKIPDRLGRVDVRWSLLTLPGDDDYPDEFEGPSMGAAFALGMAVLLASAARNLDPR